METGVKGKRTELLIAKRQPLLMYSHSSGDDGSESCNHSSYCSHKDYDNELNQGDLIPDLPQALLFPDGSHHNH